jgi:outer membrane protein OmpA-like peptidoglycan-associated protein
MMVRQPIARLSGGLTALVLAALLAACSVPNAINPVAWYRDLSGASKNDALDKDQSNEKNLEAGGKEPYPNLGSVPGAPDQALSEAKRDALQKSLAADRENAAYSDEQLRAGVAGPGAVEAPPPAPAAPAPVAALMSPAKAEKAPAKADAAPAKVAPTPPAAASAAPEKTAAAAAQPPAAAPPQESTLVAPSIAHVPEGEAPAPPPPPNLPRPAATANPAPPVTVASLSSGKTRPAPSSSVAVASISFADGSAALSDEERNRLSEVAARQHKEGGAIRVIGHAEPAKGASGTQPELDSLKLALNRAKIVAQVLSGDGVAAQSIAVEAAPIGIGEAPAAIAEVYLEH